MWNLSLSFTFLFISKSFLGKIPALTDEDGKDINPHIPSYISKTPWFYNTTAPTLRHQKNPKKEEHISINTVAKKGFVGPAATKYRKVMIFIYSFIRLFIYL